MPNVKEEPLLIDLPSCNGIEGAKMFNTHPSSRQAVFDQNEDYFYIITTDRRNVKTDIKRMAFEEAPIPKPEDLYVSKAEYQKNNEELKGAINDVKYSIQQFIAAATQNSQSDTGNKQSSSRGNGSNAKNHRGSRPDNGNVSTNSERNG